MIKFLDLGYHPPPLNFVNANGKGTEQKKFSLQVFFCNSCGLVQLGEAIDPNLMFKEYVYTSGVSTAFKEHLRSFTDLLVKRFGLTTRDLAIDIASNDGTLLEGFVKHDVKVLGVEPSNVAKIAIEKGIHTINEFFNEDTAKKILRESGQAKIITAANVFAHVDRLDSMMKGIKLLLKDDGAYVSESQYLKDIIEKLEYDTIYHEHLRYYTLTQLIRLFEKYEMEVFDAERISAQGGSIRVYASHKGKMAISDSVHRILKDEKDSKIASLETLQNFARRVEKNKQDLRSLLKELKSQGKRIVGISAPARSSTILNYCEIGPQDLEYVTEKSNLKIGKLTPGTHIPVVEDERLVQDQPDYALLLSWHLKDSIIPKIRKDGYRGKFIIPLPDVEII